MTNPITIPPAALEAAAKNFIEALDGNSWSALPPAVQDRIHVQARAACLAMLRAWPGADTGPNIYGRQNAIMHLPLTESGDE